MHGTHAIIKMGMLRYSNGLMDHFNTPTNNQNDEMDEAEMETNATAEEVEENANTNDMNPSTDEGMQTQTQN